MKQVDVIILGAGTAGLSALKEVRKKTERFLLINAGPLGTTCARVGCMPSKALIEIANKFHGLKTLAEKQLLIEKMTPAPNIAAVFKQVRQLRDYFLAGNLQTVHELGERFIDGYAKIISPQQVEVNSIRYQCRTLIIATGTQPIIPEPWLPLRDKLLTTDQLFEQVDLPKRMAVIGLGAIGLELSQALARLGVEVVAANRTPQLAKIEDEKIAERISASLREEMALVIDQDIQLQRDGESLKLLAGDKNFIIDKALIATGRSADLNALGIENLGCATDKKGIPIFNQHTMQIADLPVFIAGDLNGERALLHEASDEGRIAGFNAVQDNAVSFKRRTPLAITFSSPNLVQVGQPLSKLKHQPIVGTVDFDKQGRAKMAMEGGGLAKLYACASSGQLLGAELLAPRGEHLGHWLALAIEQSLTVDQLLATPIYHPVVEEGLRTALREIKTQYYKLTKNTPPSPLEVGLKT